MWQILGLAYDESLPEAIRLRADSIAAELIRLGNDIGRFRYEEDNHPEPDPHPTDAPGDPDAGIVW